MSVAFYRKYRPDSFDHLVGQQSVRRTLLEALKKDRLTHAYLFSGPRGTGKTSTARLIAKAIQCAKRLENGQPCLKCDPCVINGKNELIDLIEIDAASNRGIEDIRDLREKMRLAPTLAKAKVYIIDEVHMLTKEAFNALLKSLEEPPSHVYFILATTEIHKIPETIISRCQRYDFKRISQKDIIDRLKYIAEQEGLEVQLGALELLAKYADGGLRDAISLLEQFSSEALTEELVRERLGLTSHQSCDELYGALGSSDTKKGLKVIESLHNDGLDLRQFTISFLGLLRTKLHEAIHGDKKSIVPKILDWIDLFDDAWIKLKYSSIAQLPLEIAVIRGTHSTAPVMEPAPAETAVETPKAAAEVKEPIVKAEQAQRKERLMHLDAVKSQLEAVYKAIPNAVIRQSFKAGILKAQKESELEFVFTSSFHIEKVKAANGVVMIEEAFEKVMGSKMIIKTTLDAGQMTPESPEPEELGWDVVEEQIA